MPLRDGRERPTRVIGTIRPERDLAQTLKDAVVAAKQLFDTDAAGVMLADGDGQLRWASASDQLGQTIEDNQEIFGQGRCMDAFAKARPAAMCDSRRGPSSASGSRSRRIPSTYIVAAHDRTIRPGWQRRMARERLGVEPVELPTGHCPNVSRPDRLAELLLEVAGGA